MRWRPWSAPGIGDAEGSMSAIDIIRRRLKEERIPEAPWPDEVGEKKKRPREVAFMDVNLCFAPSVLLAFPQRS
jgi:hypothetical protein